MSKNLAIVCVKWGKRFGACYANILYDMVRRHLPLDYPFTFICFTDDVSGLHPDIAARALPGGLEGWWNKLYLFKIGLFEADQRILYFDLDTLITGDLEPLAHYTGEFALLRDFYRANGYGSGVMLWRAGACHSIWSRYEAAGRPEMTGGDQAWIEKAYQEADLLQDHFPGYFASYKTDCHPLPPQGTRVVCFHGEPKQDNCDSRWVRELWRIGGAKTLDANRIYKTGNDEKLDHVRQAMTLPYPWLEPTPAHERQAVVIGGGPSLNDHVEEIRQHRQQEHILFAVNNSAAWLAQQAITFDAHVMASAREEHASFVPPKSVMHYYASSCHPAIFEKAGNAVTLWHPVLLGIAALLKNDARPKTLLEGSTTGLNAIQLAYRLGYRQIHLYGFDSCYDANGAHHAYSQPDNDKDRLFDLLIEDKPFNATGWMIAQAKEFIQLTDVLIKNDCRITVYGNGLISCMAKQMASLPRDTAA